MAIKSTICKAQLAIADMDRQLYADHALTIARHPSETDERMMIRLLAFALHVPPDDRDGGLELAKGLADVDEPDLWHRDLTGRIRHWIDVGQPDDKRLIRASGRADRVTVLSYSHATPIWWRGMADRVRRLPNLDAWVLSSPQSAGLARLARRSMQLRITVQDGTVWVGDADDAVELQPTRLAPGS